VFELIIVVFIISRFSAAPYITLRGRMVTVGEFERDVEESGTGPV